MHQFFRLFFLAFASLLAARASAQDTLLLEASATAKGVTVKWSPLKPAIFAQCLTAGYRLERFEEGANTPVVLAQRLLPKDTAWFSAHKTDLDGLMEAIGALLYDTTFNFEATEDLDPAAMRYNYVVKEAQDWNPVAAAVGLLWLDSTVVSGKKYRYVVTLNSPSGAGGSGGAVSPSGVGGASGAVEIEATPGKFSRSPESIFIEFKFPGDRSLSQMRNPTPPVLPAVLGIAKAYGDSIVLRWGPNSAAFWSESNRLGYVIERSEGADGETKQIAFIKPYPEDTLEALIGNDSIALMAAAQLYSKGGTEGAEGFADLAALAENRWGFALFAAERSPLAANLLGLRFVDRDVKPGVEYEYFVTSNAAPGVFSSAWLKVKNEKTEAAAPAGFRAEAGDKVITLHWEKQALSGYHLERSSDGGKSWQPLTQNLIVFIEDPEHPLPDYSYRDSVGVNYKEFRYRLKGLTSFGDFSQTAETKGQAIDLTPPEEPLITEAIFNDTLQTATIRWDAGAIPADFDGFYVTMSEEAEGGKTDTISAKLKGSQTEFIYKPTGGFSGEEAHYFRVLAKDKNGNASSSLERYVHVPDFIAPPPPDTLVGNIADDGTVTILWSHSRAKDVIGYWLYFANNPDEEFTPLNPNPLVINTYTYKIPDVSLNKAAYYMVAAEDKSNNRGKPTPILTLRRPDKVPPVKPEFFNPVPGSNAILVNWKKSPSDDVAKYHVYRREYGSAEPFVKIGVTHSLDSFFADTAVVMEVMYDYKIQAEDQSGNLSEETLNFSARLPFEPEKMKVKEFSALPGADKKSAALKWSFAMNEKALPPGVTWEFNILKSDGSKLPEFLAAADTATFQFTDEGLLPGVIYNYAVQVRFSNGQSSPMSAVKSVMIK